MALKIIKCPWCGKEARITYEENRVYQMKCYSCHNTMLHVDHSFDSAVEFFEHQANLLQADQEWRLIVLPSKTVWELTMDAGPDCDMKCPTDVWDEALGCDLCSKATQFAYERPCTQELLKELGKTVFLTREEAEAALKGGESDA